MSAGPSVSGASMLGFDLNRLQSGYYDPKENWTSALSPPVQTTSTAPSQFMAYDSPVTGAVGVDCHHSGTDPCTYPCGPIPRNVERERTASICLPRSCLDEANIWLYDRMLAGLYWAMGDYIRITTHGQIPVTVRKTVRGFRGTTIVVFSAYTPPAPCRPGMGRIRMKRILFLQSWTF